MMRVMASLGVLVATSAFTPSPHVKLSRASADSTTALKAKGAESPSFLLDRRAALSGAGAALLSGAAWAGHAGPAQAAPRPIYMPPAGSMKGQVVVVTGANTGLGLESAKRLAAAGATIVCTARSQAKADGAAQAVASAVDDPKAALGLVLDLADLESVKAFPDRLSKALGGGDKAHIDVLLNNAGVMAIPERQETKDGFEKTVGVNHLGHFALVAGLLPLLEKAPHGFRIVTVSSDAHRFVDVKTMAAALDNGLDPTAGSNKAYGTYSAWGSYGVSKAANVLFTLELQERLRRADLPGSAVTLHPGAVQTDLGRYIIGGASADDVRLSETAAAPAAGSPGALLKKALDTVVLPVPQGANTQVFLSAAADVGGDLAAAPGGLFFNDLMKPVAANAAASDPVLAARLWDLSEKLTGVTFKGL